MIFLFDYSLTMPGNYNTSSRLSIDPPRPSIDPPRPRVNLPRPSFVSNFIIKYLIKIFKNFFLCKFCAKNCFLVTNFILS